jgi:hypothetical protein
LATVTKVLHFSDYALPARLLFFRNSLALLTIVTLRARKKRSGIGFEATAALLSYTESI